jgi:hypothetical protein
LRVFVSKVNDGYTGYGADLRLSFEKMGLEGQDEAYLRYYVWVPADWNSWAGGKMPSLSGISPGETPFSTSGGGEYHETSWWGGLNWVGTNDGNLDHTRMSSFIWAKEAGGTTNDATRNPANNRMGGINVRLRANPDYRNPWGNTNPYLYIRRGQWNMMEIHYKMNTPGVANGVYQAWLNGQMGVDLRDVMYRTNSTATTRNLDINQVMFLAFYGGPTANKTDQTFWIEDMVISRAPIGPRR